MIFKNKRFLPIGVLCFLLMTQMTFAGKPRIAVVDFSVKVPKAHAQLGSSMADILIDALVQSKRYVVLERSVLDKIRDEQGLAADGEVDAATGAQIGKLIGAQFLVVGVVSKFQEKTGGGGLGGLISRRLPGGIGWMTSELGITVRVIDSSTGEIIASENVKQKERAVGIGALIPGIPAGVALFKSKSMQKALEKAIVKSVEFIGKQIPEDVEGLEGVTFVKLKAAGVNFRSLKVLMGIVEGMDGVENPTKVLRGNNGEINFLYEGSVDQFADQLDLRRNVQMPFEIVNLSETELEIEIAGSNQGQNVDIGEGG